MTERMDFLTSTWACPVLSEQVHRQKGMPLCTNICRSRGRIGDWDCVRLGSCG